MQPPPGYPQNPQPSGPPNRGPQQHPQGPQGYQQGPPQGYQQGYQQGPPPYGMSPPPYYPPQKRGMPGWAIALIVCGVLFVVMVMGLAAIPLIVSNDRDARRAEGEQLMGTARDYLRVEYSKTGDANGTLRGFRGGPEFQGIYYQVDSTASRSSKPGFDGTVTCSPRKSQSDGRGTLNFAWGSANSEITWK